MAVHPEGHTAGDLNVFHFLYDCGQRSHVGFLGTLTADSFRQILESDRLQVSSGNGDGDDHSTTAVTARPEGAVILTIATGEKPVRSNWISAKDMEVMPLKLILKDVLSR